MTNPAKVKFDNIIKQGFHAALKPLGFRKKANNFYIFKNGIGCHINIQKSISSDRNNINFTINAGLFVPEIWHDEANYFNEPTHPDFPAEYECTLRRRIGQLKNTHDEWYNVNESTSEENLIMEMRKNIADFILPFFSSMSSREKVLDALIQQRKK